ncbi:C-5 sterol desaturase [Uncinocarpus reesii 1704]|uniref:C-5 sterol desaturase n=1 Tax=Uncinocarpus reesii (strain UAMH 1704) TaxID=336963 RepID=C4JPH3_UNCRE|nr:C-5 sterol desaturase [Uncinocarpus reesii 1704]EEP78299.1 C-5 sterol desaturase [Uncinocarpus reesii 1704]
MDVVLEVFDTFLFDYLYAYAVPVPQQASLVSSQIADGLNKTASAVGNGFVYRPASQYLNFEPSAYAYMSTMARDNVYRQILSMFFITWVFGVVVYFIFATLSYVLIFDKTTVNHPKYLKNQMRLEIIQTLRSLPGIAILTVPFFVTEIRGHAKMYDTFEEAPFKLYNFLQFPLFFMFTDFFIYWIHRGLHHPLIYKRLHKPHHKWIMPTPYASHAFHPVDGWAQSLPYHIFPFIFPLQKFAYVALFVAINVWTILIHDGEYATNNPVINGAACHTMHHLYFNYNYGQFTTLWDRLGNSYRRPNEELFRRESKMDKEEWNRQVQEMEALVKEVEGEDDRQYEHEENVKKNL